MILIDMAKYKSSTTRMILNKKPTQSLFQRILIELRGILDLLSMGNLG